MISFLRGTLVHSVPEYAVIDVRGVGYKVLIPTSTFYKLPKLGEEIKIHTYLHVREDILQLFGFIDENNLSLFEILINVSGIGPKNGLSILSAITPEGFKQAIFEENLNVLTKIPGIGKKTAQRMILELKDKIKMEEIVDQRELLVEDFSSESVENAQEALIMLGYSKNEARKALDAVCKNNTNTDVELLIKEALKLLAKG